MFVTINDYLMLFESVESRNQSKARKVCVSYGDTNPQKTTEYCRNLVSNIRQYDCKFLPAVCRMYFNGEFDEEGKAASLNSVIKYLEHHLDEYDNDLNGETALNIINRFNTKLSSEIDNDRKNIGEYNQRNNEYKIVRISSYEDAAEYREYVSWCITQTPEAYYSYTNGTGIFYFLLKDGYKELTRRAVSTSPDGEYAMSMIAVSVNADGSLNTSTCRWNHDHGCNDKMYSTKKISDILGCNFYEALPPKDVLGDWIEKIKNGTARRIEILDGYFTIMDKSDTESYAVFTPNNKLIGNIYDSIEFIQDRFFILHSRLDYYERYYNDAVDIYDIHSKKMIINDAPLYIFTNNGYQNDSYLRSMGLLCVKINGEVCVYSLSEGKSIKFKEEKHLYIRDGYIVIFGKWYDSRLNEMHFAEVVNIIQRDKLFYFDEYQKGLGDCYKGEIRLDYSYEVLVTKEKKLLSHNLYKNVIFQYKNFIVCNSGDNSYCDLFNLNGKKIKTCLDIMLYDHRSIMYKTQESYEICDLNGDVKMVLPSGEYNIEKSPDYNFIVCCRKKGKYNPYDNFLINMRTFAITEPIYANPEFFTEKELLVSGDSHLYRLRTDDFQIIQKYARVDGLVRNGKNLPYNLIYRNPDNNNYCVFINNRSRIIDNIKDVVDYHQSEMKVTLSLTTGETVIYDFYNKTITPTILDR